EVGHGAAGVDARRRALDADENLTAAILTPGGRTVANLLPTPWRDRPRPSHRLPVRPLPRPRSAPEPGCAPAGFLFAPPVPDGSVVLVGDDTVDGRPILRQVPAPRPGPVHAQPHRQAVWP